MSLFEEPAKAPEPQAPVKVEEPAVAAAETASVSQAEVVEHASRLDRVKARLASQPKVRVRLQEDTPVIINGYPMYIQGKVWVEVPESVAEILEQAERF